mgnify:FL=1
MTIGPGGAVLVAGMSIVALVLLPRLFRACGALIRRLRERVPRRHRPVVLTVLLLISGCLALGALQCIGLGASFARFNSLDLLPRVLELAVTRELGSRAAGASGTLITLVMLDGSARATAPEPSPEFLRQVVFAGVVTVLLYAPACTLILLGALIAWHSWFGQAPGAFFIVLEEAFAWDDLITGVIQSAVHAVILIAVLLGGRRLWTSTNWSLGSKVATVVAVSVAVRFCEWASSW